MSLMEEEMVIIEMPDGNKKRVPKSSVEESGLGLKVDGKEMPGAKIVQTPPEDTGAVNPDGTSAPKPLAPSTPKPSDTKTPAYPSDDMESRRTQPGYGGTKEPEKPSTSEVPQPNVDPSGLANQAGPGSAAMANQLAQAGVGAGGGQPNQSGGVNLNFANMFAGQFAKGPVNIGGNQQVSSGSGAQTMNFGTMASGGAVVSGGGISGKVATGRGSIDSGNTSTTTTNTSNVNSGNTNSGNTTTETRNTNSGNTTTETRNTNSGNTTTKTNTNSGNRTKNSTTNSNKNVNVSGRGNKVTANENFELKINQTLNEMNRLFGRKDGGLRKS